MLNRSTHYETIAVPDDCVERLTSLAKRANVPVSTIIEHALSAFLVVLSDDAILVDLERSESSCQSS
jgi:predicted transcriptional regulator